MGGKVGGGDGKSEHKTQRRRQQELESWRVGASEAGQRVRLYRGHVHRFATHTRMRVCVFVCMRMRVYMNICVSKVCECVYVCVIKVCVCVYVCVMCYMCTCISV